MRAIIFAAFACLLSATAQAGDARTAQGLSLLGELKYPADFAHFDYVNPDAPKGGTVRLYALGNFDNLNPFIAKGNAASGLSLTYDSLMKRSLDEPGAEYGLLASSVEVPADESYVTFTLRPEARWHDGKPVTADDVVFSFETLRDKGNPFFRFYYQNVEKVEALDATHVKFTFAVKGNRELPHIMGELMVLPKHYWEGRDFTATTLTPPLTSGPYEIESVDPSKGITYKRVENYWGKDLPVNVGQNNFDHIAYINFTDPDVALIGLFSDSYDFRPENSAKNWASEYDDKPPVKAGAIVRENPTLKNPEPMQAFVFNLDHDLFKDERVRLALDYAFDFEWTNKNIFYGQYARTTSFFESSEFAATGVPEGLELEVLEPFRDKLPPELFTTPYSEPKTDGSGTDRENLRKAKELLEAAGWHFKDGQLVNDKTGQPFAFEFLDVNERFGKIFLPYADRLKRLGINATYRSVDETQFLNRVRKFDYDVIMTGWAQSNSPGNEQREMWGSKAADSPDSSNYAHIRNPIVDALIDKIIFATDRAHLVAATKALDRVLLWNHYVVPGWYAPTERLAYWNRFSHPEKLPDYDVGFPDIWWYDAAKAKATAQREAQAK